LSSPSAAYAAALQASKEIHKGKSFTGKFLRPHAIFIKEIIDRLGCKTVLDYGAGKGQQYEWIIPSTGQTIEEFWGVTVTKYDPAYPPFAEKPNGFFDLVICTQVLGTIPVDDLPWVIDDIYQYSSKAIYVSERLGDVRKVIGDQSLRPLKWTLEQWQKALTRSRPVEITLATREIIDGAKITSHSRRPKRARNWRSVVWPAGVGAMNHKWVPDA
jgi:hypothetical protein